MMDKSEANIKMCEKAVEIQELYRRNLTVRYTPENAGYLMDSKLDYLYRTKLGDIPIWLPRQDQLQEMFDNTQYSAFRNYFFFSDWIEEYILDEEHVPKQEYKNWSMEQLWLAFVMKEKYHKIWNGEDWVMDKA